MTIMTECDERYVSASIQVQWFIKGYQASLKLKYPDKLGAMVQALEENLEENNLPSLDKRCRDMISGGGLK
jgi:hypothetical protein